MHQFLKLAVLGFVYTASAFDLEDYATTYRATRDAYLKAANELKLATGPYKAARDAYVAATATYTKSLYERRRLTVVPAEWDASPAGVHAIGDMFSGMVSLQDWTPFKSTASAERLSCFFPRREPGFNRDNRGISDHSVSPIGWQKHNQDAYSNRFSYNRILCTANILSRKSEQCFPEAVDLNVVDDPEMCESVEKSLRTETCRLVHSVKLSAPKDYYDIVNAAGAGAAGIQSQTAEHVHVGEGGPTRRLWLWKIDMCRQDIFHSNIGVTSRNQFAYKIPGEESCLVRIKVAQEVNRRIARAIVDKRIANVKRGASPCINEMEALDNVLVGVKRADLELRFKVSAVLGQQLEAV